MSGPSSVTGSGRTGSTNLSGVNQVNLLQMSKNLARNEFLERIKRAAIKALAYLGGATLIGGGGALCALPLPVVAQAFGGGMIAGGVMIIGAAVCYDNREVERLERANDRYIELNNVNASNINRLGGEVESLRSANNQYRDQNEAHQQNISNLQEIVVNHETTIITLGTEVENLQSENRQYHILNETQQQNIANLQGEVTAISQERERNIQVIERMSQIANQLDGSMSLFLSNIQNNNELESEALNNFNEKITVFDTLISRLEGESIAPLANMLHQIEGFASNVSELMSIEGRLRNTYQQFYRMEGRLQQLTNQYEETGRILSEEVENLRDEIGKLRGEISMLEQQKSQNQQLIGNLSHEIGNLSGIVQTLRNDRGA